MNAPPIFPPSGPPAGQRQPPNDRSGVERATAAGSASTSTSGANATSLRWAALGDAGAVVAILAAVAPEPADRRLRNFSVMIRDCPPWQRQLVENAVADLAAVMEPGLAALLAINARGADAGPAARALWHEFRQSRSAITALIPAGGDLGPLRRA